MAAGGFLASALTSLWRHPLPSWTVLRAVVDVLEHRDANNIHQKEEERNHQRPLTMLLRRHPLRALGHLVLLRRLQQTMRPWNMDHECHTTAPDTQTKQSSSNAFLHNNNNQNNNDNQNSTNNNNSTSNNHHGYIPTVEQAQRYMRYATATYGDVMIRAVQLDLWGGGYHPPHYHSDDHWRLFTNTTLHTHRICSHVGVPHKDLVQQRLLDDDDDDDDNLKWYHHHDPSQQCVRHLVAVDHGHQEIVLAVRGTFTVAEIITDLTAHSVPFAGTGQAHAAMADAATALWDAVGPVVRRTWEAYPDYTLVLTGHSLGAGVVHLLHILLLQQCYPNAQAMRCVTFASPPVYTASAPPSSSTAAVNFVHRHDVVPYLSLDAVRHLLHCLQWMEEQRQSLSRLEQWRLVTLGDPRLLLEHWADALAHWPRPAPVPGAPVLQIPAATNICLTPVVEKDDALGHKKLCTADHHHVYYRSHFCDARQMATAPLGIPLDFWNMLHDHFPARYEYALQHLAEPFLGRNHPNHQVATNESSSSSSSEK